MIDGLGLSQVSEDDSGGADRDEVLVESESGGGCGAVLLVDGLEGFFFAEHPGGLSGALGLEAIEDGLCA